MVAIEKKPGVWGGKTVVRGTRVPVFVIRSLRRSGESITEIAGRYPHISVERIAGALEYSTNHQEVIDKEEREYARAVERLRPQ